MAETERAELSQKNSELGTDEGSPSPQLLDEGAIETTESSNPPNEARDEEPADRDAGEQLGTPLQVDGARAEVDEAAGIVDGGQSVVANGEEDSETKAEQPSDADEEATQPHQLMEDSQVKMVVSEAETQSTEQGAKETAEEDAPPETRNSVQSEPVTNDDRSDGGISQRPSVEDVPLLSAIVQPGEDAAPELHSRSETIQEPDPRAPGAMADRSGAEELDANDAHGKQGLDLGQEDFRSKEGLVGYDRDNFLGEVGWKPDILGAEEEPARNPPEVGDQEIALNDGMEGPAPLTAVIGGRDGSSAEVIPLDERQLKALAWPKRGVPWRQVQRIDSFVLEEKELRKNEKAPLRLEGEPLNRAVATFDLEAHRSKPSSQQCFFRTIH